MWGRWIVIGYLNREELNKTSFIDNPSNLGKGSTKQGITGDGYGCNIEFHGRQIIN